jgi:murein DD-endopeptidase MepM/ murein hydrolase activator NlpD
MSVNALSNPNLRLGQKLYLPVEAAEHPSDGGVAAARAVEAARPAPVPLASASPDTVARYGASYTVKPGDSLYGIAREHGVKVAELQEVNGITDAHRVKPGMALKVPGRAVAERSTPPAAPRFEAHQPVTHDSVAIVPPIEPSDAPAGPARYGQATTTQPTIINGERRVASLNDRSTDATSDAQPPAQSVPQPSAERPKPGEKVAIGAPPGAAAIADGAKLRWPAIGKIIAGFGGRPDGTHNDGINVSVPLGTDVHAAEAGVVAYAGSELKGYGNLVLLRHDNGWVTAYAHNDELLVKRGDKVKRGDVIAKAGKTGSVDRPQIHFELREGSRPVDPLPYLEKL